MTHAPWSYLITEEQISILHAESIQLYGGLLSPARDGCVDGSLGSAWHAESFASEEDSVLPGLVFAAALMFSLVTKHCFGDGNKRIGLAAMLHVLLQHGLTINATQEELENLVLGIARGERRSAQSITNWLTDRLESIDPTEQAQHSPASSPQHTTPNAKP